MSRISLLDCTLRDGAYIVDGKFGKGAIKGIISKLSDARVDIIECGWLKNDEHDENSTYYHLPEDIIAYLPPKKRQELMFVTMIDYNRYDLSYLQECDSRSIDAIRIVFPKDHMDEGLALVKPIRDKGYRVFLQAANTYGYSDYELIELCGKVNRVMPEALSIVDTFGAMYERELLRILYILDNNLDKRIALGFHSHNNQQQSFSLSMKFVETLSSMSERNVIIDSSLCGMGRGAGNTPTELIASFLNRNYLDKYDMNMIMDAIDMYMTYFLSNYTWGYSIPYMISGTYACHVNNVKYLTKTHRTRNKDLKNVFESMNQDDRTRYDYGLLEEKYQNYQKVDIDDSVSRERIIKILENRKIAAIVPGSSVKFYSQEILGDICENHLLTVGINAAIDGYDYDCLFFSNAVKYEIAKDTQDAMLKKATVILTSNIKMVSELENEIIVNYNSLVKHEWKYYDNSLIFFLRLIGDIGNYEVHISGFDGFKGNSGYAESVLNTDMPESEISQMQEDLEAMFSEFIKKNSSLSIQFITDSMFAEIM